MNKLTVTARRIGVVFRIISIILAAGLIITGAGAVFSAAAPILRPEALSGGFSSLSAGFLTLDLAPGTGPDQQAVLMQLCFTMVCGFVLLLVSMRCVRLIRDILSPMEKGEPFAPSIGSSFKKLSVMTIVCGVLINLITLVNELIIFFCYDLAGLFVGDRITHVTLTHTFDVDFLIIAAVFYLASFVFSYGAQLQQLSDETL